MSKLFEKFYTDLVMNTKLVTFRLNLSVDTHIRRRVEVMAILMDGLTSSEEG